ncbi:MAG: hypothetical protein KatS3mg057_1641 [Herpetosiphonaceae bacterium]|nr:MAG: hypothetical protein KatS3mg057_1641 [Herpetosiphonaceae bacterium]
MSSTRLPPRARRNEGLQSMCCAPGSPCWLLLKPFFELAEQGEVEVVGEPCVDWLGVPLKQGEATFGVVAVQSYTPSVRFSEREKELLTFVGQQLAVALERKQAAETVRLSKAQAAEAAAHAEAAERHAHTMEMVHRLSQALSSRHDEQEILDLAARELVGMFWADHTSIVLFDDDGRWGIVVAEAPVNEAVGLRFAAGEDALLVELQESRRPVYVESIASDPRPLRSRDQLLHLGYVSLMLVPLIVRDRIIGAIQLDSAGKARHFTQAEQDLFLTLANAIAAAIENARLYASVQQELAERVRAEQERSQLQEEIIRMQQSLLAELSTPLFPISDYVVVMPLVGAIDSNRARGIIEALLHGVQEHRARVAILDITGVPVVDTQVANALMHAAQSVRLLGAQVILTGIRPEVAQTMVGLGVELGSIITRGTLQDAIKFVLSGR